MNATLHMRYQPADQIRDGILMYGIVDSVTSEVLPDMYWFYYEPHRTQALSDLNKATMNNSNPFALDNALALVLELERHSTKLDDAISLAANEYEVDATALRVRFDNLRVTRLKDAVAAMLERPNERIETIAETFGVTVEAINEGVAAHQLEQASPPKQKLEHPVSFHVIATHSIPQNCFIGTITLITDESGRFVASGHGRSAPCDKAREAINSLFPGTAGEACRLSIKRIDPNEPPRAEVTMRYQYFTVNNAWAFTFGDAMIRLHLSDTLFFQKRLDGIDIAQRCGLAVSKTGRVTVAAPTKH